MLTLLAMRDRMIVAKRYGEIERMEKEIEALRLKVKLKESKRVKEQHAIERGKLEIRHKAEVEHLRAVKQRELDVMMMKREKDFQFDHRRLKVERTHLEEHIGHAIAWS